MKQNSRARGLIAPTMTFFLLYLILHLYAFGSVDSRYDARMILISLSFGAILGAVNAFLAAKWGKQRFWREFRVFWGWYAVVQVVSGVLFWASMTCDLPRDGALWALFYWFPQMLVVAFTIPGAVVYHLIGYAAYRRIIIQ